MHILTRTLMLYTTVMPLQTPFLFEMKRLLEPLIIKNMNSIPLS